MHSHAAMRDIPYPRLPSASLGFDCQERGSTLWLMRVVSWPPRT